METPGGELIDGFEQSCLAAAGGADQHDKLAGLDGHIDVGEDFMVLVALGNIPKFNHLSVPP